MADIAYLARSGNRVEILEALVAGPRSPRELAAETAASRSTLGRILTELEERGWAERTTGGEYGATAVGEFAAAEFGPVVGSMAALRTLGEAVAWLPREELTVGLHRFSDATVSRPESNCPMAPDTRLVALIREASEFRCLVRIAPSLAFERVMRDAVVDGDLRTEHVLTTSELDYLNRDPERRRRWREYLEAGADVFRYDGTIPCNLFVVDERVLVTDREPEVCAFIETTDGAVRQWGCELVGRYRADAERLDAGAFAPEPPPSTG